MKADEEVDQDSDEPETKRKKFDAVPTAKVFLSSLHLQVFRLLALLNEIGDLIVGFYCLVL